MTGTSPNSWDPRYYDDCLGPLWFDAFAADLALRLPAAPPGDVLEIACGTGIGTRRLRERLAHGVHLVAIDASRAMLEYARGRVGATGEISWCEANAMTLPFGGRSFGALACGFAMMFMPDRQASLQEARRVLRPGATFVFSVWDRMQLNPHALAAAEKLAELFPNEPSVRIGIGYDMGDPDALRQMLTNAGFRTMRIESRRIAVTCPDPRTIATGLVRGTPRAALIARQGASLERVIDQLAQALAATGGIPYRSHAQAVFAEAVAA